MAEECEFCGCLVDPDNGYEHKCGDCGQEIDSEDCLKNEGYCDHCAWSLCH